MALILCLEVAELRLSGLWGHPEVVGGGAELHSGVVLLGLHHLAGRRGAGDAEIGHEKGVWVCTAGDGYVQLVHPVGQRDPLWVSDCSPVRAGLRLGKSKLFFKFRDTIKKILKSG